MPIEYRIDHQRRLVMAEGHGVLTDQDVFNYQRDVWSMLEVRGYDELVDVTRVEHIALPSVRRVRDLARLSATMEAGSSPSRFAIVAPTTLAYGLGCMYEAYRSLDERSTKKVAVFRSRNEALAFLGVNTD